MSCDDDMFRQMETFVFMDFETTGLIANDLMDPFKSHPTPGDKNRDTERALRELIVTTPIKNLPYITEMSFVTAPRSLVLNAIEEMKQRSEDDSNGSMAVRLACNVHTRQVKPPLNEQQWKEYENKRKTVEAIKLSRGDLEDKNTFAEEWPGVLHMLQTCKKPVCIVAHNGVYFLDSYFAFIDLEKEYHNHCKSAVQLMDFSIISQNLLTIKEEEATGPTEPQATATIVRDRTPPPKEMAPAPSVHRLTQSEPRAGAKRRLFQDQLPPDSPLNFMRSSQWSPARKRRLTSARELFVRKQDGDWRFDEGASTQYFRKKGAFRLDEMYEQLMNNKHDSHFAQDDCYALLQISICFGRDFIDYADAHSMILPY
ncbi:hypothetical protein QR680_007249 [Steinernema hermaphroditum]|uniref:Exonuclease domain-containing protein n=1 Tax=Steinernema hermaphroditum TaxID=289476 RepID=A0AA39LYI8_9BILA|nr:hypothetical protein QR680_007249 [Steinernema hermaphroditum]